MTDDILDLSIDMRKISGMRKLLQELKPVVQRKQGILAHEQVVEKMREILEEDVRNVKLGPFDMNIHVVDWVEPDEYFLADENLVQALCDIAEKHGPKMARELLWKICRSYGRSEKSTD